MAIQTFPWQMDMGATADKQYRVNKTQFGDGYAQLSSIGINNIIKNWSGTKTGALDTVIKPIEAFIDEHAFLSHLCGDEVSTPRGIVIGIAKLLDAPLSAIRRVIGNANS